MGFFKDLKQDSNKANDETTDAVNAETSEETTSVEPEAATEDDLDEDMYKDILAAAEQMLTDDDSEENESGEESDEQSEKEEKQSEEEVEEKKEEKVENTMVDYDENAVDSEILDTLLQEETAETKKDEAVEEKEKEKERGSHSELTQEDKEAVTVITKGTTINGSIISDCSLDVMGTINGDIECLGKLSISGKVIGNSMASEVYVNTERLEGSISSEGSVKIGVGTVVVGDITATSGVIAGAVKGEIDVSGPVVIDSTAIIKGNVKAKSVQMNNGAVLEGFCSLSYADVDIDNIFE